jgi:sec-independent protein translocase protein TatC
MADPSEAPRPDPGDASPRADSPPPEPAPEVILDEDDKEGGPVKSFLEHLEDLRWVIIKCGAAIMIAMVVCLLDVKDLVRILKWPLERSSHVQSMFDLWSKDKQVTIFVGTNRWTSFPTRTSQFGSLPLGTNRNIVLQVAPVLLEDGRHVLEIRAATNLPPELASSHGPGLIFLDPAAPFISSLHLAFFGGMILSAPFVFYFLGQFLVPALRFREKKYGLRAFAIGLGLFVTGVCFCYFGIMPFALRAAEAYSLWMGVQMPDWRAETYFSFVTKFMLGMGLGFELPVVLLALVKIGLLDYKKLASMRRYMIVVNLILGALLTTPEVFTQLLMAVPLQVLYEIAVWIAWYWERKEKRRSAAETSS